MTFYFVIEKITATVVTKVDTADKYRDMFCEPIDFTLFGSI